MQLPYNPFPCVEKKIILKEKEKKTCAEPNQTVIIRVKCRYN